MLLGGLCPFDQWTGCSWWDLPVLLVNQAFFPYIALRLPLARVVTPCFWVPDPKTSVGRIVHDRECCVYS